MPGMDANDRVQMWFDPICPWAWLTSRWLMEVEQVRPVEVLWRVMSLSVLNEGRDLPAGYQQLMRTAWAPVRVLMAVEQSHGRSAVKALYDAIGTRIHVQQRLAGGSPIEEVIAESLAECWLPLELGEAAHGDGHDEALRASHAEGIGLVGTEVGTPVVAFGEIAFFGPVVTPAPQGEAAGRLWDGCLLVAGTPGFFELKRTRTVEPIFH